MTEITSLFPPDYATSRARFRQSLAFVRRAWPTAHLSQQALDEDPALTIDWLQADALARHERLLILTAGQHGIEAYVGTAMLQLFLQETLPRLDPERTGLLIVHTLNPWGMQHRRRTNAANVDLNRNFYWDPPEAKETPDRPYDSACNPDYTRLNDLINPQGPVPGPLVSDLRFALRLLRCVVKTGVSTLRRAVLLGQYRFPQGIYYGGTAPQKETQVLMDLYRRHIGDYSHIVHLDMHSGYGPRYQMSLVNSALEPRDSETLAARFDYPQVVKANPDEFYPMQGDMIDWVYQWVRHEYPERQLYAASFEFGTLGESIVAAVRSLRAMILENQMYWYGAQGRAAARVQHKFRELFVPSAARWRLKATADARQAFEGILRAEGFI
jgi:predicted deacylase